jgi:ferric-dicitrate binding protein FerR (iron transport regulator)
MKPEKLKLIPQWTKTKEDIWKETFTGLDDTNTTTGAEQRVKRSPLWKYAAAAVIAVVLVGTFIARQYTVTQVAERGVHHDFLLPDGSFVNLNAESELSYKPYWWLISREVKLKGEACFKVKPGERFQVFSDQNCVTVMGTSFDVFARPEMYRVACLTGKVKVFANNETTLLKPNMQLTCRNGKLTVDENSKLAQATEWTQNKFVFSGVPLREVLEEIERQYDIRIVADTDTDFIYTGNFPKTKNPEEVLEIIGKPFGIKFNIE